MVLSLSMSSGRTMPATISSRISKLTRTSCLPSITRLPFGSTCVTTRGDVGQQRLLAVDRALAVARCRRVGGEDARRQRRVRWIGSLFLPKKLSTPESSLFLRLRWVSLAIVGLVGDVDLDGEDVADLVRALVLEEGARAVAPQRIRIVGGGLRRRHRHLHRLVAGLRGRVVDRGQRRLLADLASAGRTRRSRSAATRQLHGDASSELTRRE